MATAAEPHVKDKIFIGGEWVEPRGAEPMQVVNPTTEEGLGTIPGCSPEDVNDAVAAARTAFEAWSQAPREVRARHITAIAEGLNERGDEIAATITQELGMPLKLSRIIQVGLPASQFAAMPQLMEE